MEKSLAQHYTQFLTDLEESSKVEEKIRLCLDFMKGSLSDAETVDLGQIWKARELCLPLFKEKIPARLRTLYWAEYVELSEGMRKVKEVLDEQSSFASEQIQLALFALKQDLEKFEALVLEMEPIAIPENVEVIKNNSQLYIKAQAELDLLSTFAGRIESLRKELIHTPMRIRQKNRFFGELSKLGDIVFPRRKEAISLLSDQFRADVASFQIEEEKTLEAKEGIKSLQAFAKTLSLHTKAFTAARGALSELWDQIKEWEKQKKQQRAKQRKEFAERMGQILPKIELLQTQCDEGEITLASAQKQEQELLEEIQKLRLNRDEEKLLRKKLFDALRPLEKRRQEALAKEKEALLQKEESERKAQAALLHRLTELSDHAESLSLDTLVEKWEALVKEEKALTADGVDRERVIHQIDAISDHIEEKKWQALMEDSSEEAIHQMHALLDNRHKARRKLKETIDVHRKTAGGSGLTLEQSLLYQEMIAEEKLRLDAIETMIEELEEGLFDLEE